MTIPKSLQPVLWSKKISLLDKEDDKDYIIHQVLSLGDMKQVRWLMDAYGAKRVRSVFLQHPQRVYSPSAFHFCSRFIIDAPKIRAQKYVQASLRDS